MCGINGTIVPEELADPAGVAALTARATSGPLNTFNVGCASRELDGSEIAHGMERGGVAA